MLWVFIQSYHVFQPATAFPPANGLADKQLAVMEIEMWKKTERDKFAIHLKDLESKQSDALAEEFKKRERQRELLIRRKSDEIAKLEAKLQDSIRLLDEREKRIAADEERIQRERKAMKV